ncbi:MAG: EF-P lysine aminoacylase GenX [Fibrobacter sp.]|nr:EF-P lysine aminoacylase GenX [Fibrobacter sp.]
MWNAPNKQEAPWRPSASLKVWRQRLDLINAIRSFFVEKNVLEVDVPVLSRAMGTDPYLDYFAADYFVDYGANTTKKGSYPQRFMITSPEFHLKRLLAADFGCIYSLGHVFRNGEVGSQHNPEFTMLEWYRVGRDWEFLMDEVAELVRVLGAVHGGATKKAWLQKNYVKTPWNLAWQKYAQIDVNSAEIKDFKSLADQHKFPQLENANLEEWVDYLFTMLVEPRLGAESMEFIVDYPPEMAALALVDHNEHGELRSRRFELYIQGVELCNGYEELVDAGEQKHRFQADLQKRKVLGKRLPPIDYNFLAALHHGLPPCSGVALGFDRLVQWILGAENISEVMLFFDDIS